MSNAMHLGVVKFDNAAGSITDYSAEVIAATLNMKPMLGEHHVLGTRGGIQTVGGYTGDITIDVETNTGTTAAYYVLNIWALSATTATYTASKSFEFYSPDSSTSGSVKYTGEMFPSDLGNGIDLGAGKGDVQKASFKLKTSGNLTAYTVV